MLATSPHSGSARFVDSLHLVTKDVVWNAAGRSKQLKGSNSTKSTRRLRIHFGGMPLWRDATLQVVPGLFAIAY